MAASLTARQSEAFWRDGYLFPLRALSVAEAGQSKRSFEKLMGDWTNSPSLPRPVESYLRANLHVVSTAASALCCHPAILDAVEALLGPDLMVWMAELIIKEPRSPHMLSMHQDLNYWGFAESDEQVTAWLSLSAATRSNGAMRFVTGSHRLGPVPHVDTFAAGNLLSRGQQAQADYDTGNEVDVLLAPGEFSLHHGLMLHRSGPNTTRDRRVSLVIRYVTPAQRKAVGPRDYAMVVRGVNRTAHMASIAAPSADFDAAGLALHAEIENAQHAALSYKSRNELSYTR